MVEDRPQGNVDRVCKTIRFGVSFTEIKGQRTWTNEDHSGVVICECKCSLFSADVVFVVTICKFRNSNKERNSETGCDLGNEGVRYC